MTESSTKPVRGANPGLDGYLSPVPKGRFFHRTVPELEAKINALAGFYLTHS
jgi:hypothetical protein